MKYSEAQQGRTFVVRLEDGDTLHESIETLAREKGIMSAAVIVVGGADAGSVLISGPRVGRPKAGNTVEPMVHVLEAPHEITGTGTIFPDKNDNPVLHIHIACGRKKKTKTGCARRGVKVWHVMEVIIIELIGSNARRVSDPATGFELLVP
jgi:predicted DNA-binding protein with PD1-like motif